MNDMMQYWQQEWDRWHEEASTIADSSRSTSPIHIQKNNNPIKNKINIGYPQRCSPYQTDFNYTYGSIGWHLNILNKTKSGKFIINKLSSNDNGFYCYITGDNDDPNCCRYERNKNQIYLFKYNKRHQIIDDNNQSGISVGMHLAHELFHAFQDYEGIDYYHSAASEIEAYIFCCIYFLQYSKPKEFNIKKIHKNISPVFQVTDSYSQICKSYRDAVLSLVKKYDDRLMEIAVNNFFDCSIKGLSYKEEGYSLFGNSESYDVTKSILRKYQKQIYQ